MPVHFLTEEQKQRYGGYLGEPTQVQLEKYFYLDDVDHNLIRVRRGNHNRLGFAVQLGTVRFLGRFLELPLPVPSIVVAYLAAQLEIEDVSCLSRYEKRRPTHREHRQIIKHHYDYLDFSSQPHHWHFMRWLYDRAWVGTEGPSVLFDLATAYLLDKRLLLPGVSVLERLVATVRERISKRVWKRLSDLPNPEQCRKLEGLLKVDETAKTTKLEQLRRSPTRRSGPALVAALRRLREVRAMGVHRLAIHNVPPNRLKALSRSALVSRAQTIERMKRPRRIATLLAFVHELEATAQDDALIIFELVMKDLLAKSVTQGKKERWRTLKDLDSAALTLSRACELLISADCDSEMLREAIFAEVSSTQITTAIEQVKDIARPPDDQYYPEILSRWRSVRLFLPTLLNTIDFQATKAGTPVLAAIDFLKSIEGKRRPDMTQAPLDMVSKGWLSQVCPEPDQIERRAYTFCILEKVLEGLRRRELYVTPSLQWSNPEEKLLQGEAWTAVRAQVCRTLNLDVDCNQQLVELAQQLDSAYRQTASRLPGNAAVTIVEEEDQRPELSLSPLEKLDEPESLQALKAQVKALLPRIDLPEVLLEIHQKTGFLDEFTHAHEQGVRIENIAVSLSAVLVAMGCNIGLKPLQRKEIPALSRGCLAWVQQHYIRPETLINANARLVAAQRHIPIVNAWGGGEVASADGLRFTVPVKTIHAGSNPKYFNRGRGVTYYNFISNQFMGFHGLVVPGTLRDSLVVLTGLLEHKTDLRPRELMTDNAAYSDIVFGLFWLLGYQFSPRLADIGQARFWRIDAQADYGLLDSLARQRIKPHRIENLWDDVLRLGGSLQLGKLSALEAMRVLQRAGQPSSLGKAIGELGRIAKTLYLLNYLDDDTYRRRILTQLNRGESRHDLARTIYHGRKGELWQRYREGQEEQLNALGLVTNVIILWNTLYMNQALEHLRTQGWDIRPDDVARLSPLGFSHINMLGRYYFELSDDVRNGSFRPLRDPNDKDDSFY